MHGMGCLLNKFQDHNGNLIERIASACAHLSILLLHMQYDHLFGTSFLSSHPPRVSLVAAKQRPVCDR
jgi:hypothetical protein